MIELQSAYKAARRKTQFRGPVFSLGQTAPTLGFALCFYYGGYLISTEGLHYTNVIKLVYFAMIIYSKTKFLFLTNAKYCSTLRSLFHFRFKDYVFLLHNY